MKALLSILIVAGGIAFIAGTQNTGWLKTAFIAVLSADGSASPAAVKEAWEGIESQISPRESEGGWAVVKVTSSSKGKMRIQTESLFVDHKDDRQEGDVVIDKESELAIRRPAHGEEHTIEIAAGWEKIIAGSGRVMPPPCRALIHFEPAPRLELVGGSSIVSETENGWTIAAKDSSSPFFLHVGIEWQ